MSRIGGSIGQKVDSGCQRLEVQMIANGYRFLLGIKFYRLVVTCRGHGQQMMEVPSLYDPNPNVCLGSLHA